MCELTNTTPSPPEDDGDHDHRHEAGTEPFTCATGMCSGTLLVVDPPSALGRRALSRSSAQVVEAAWMAVIEASRAASNSSSVICADSPSVRAREKLAITPGLRASRASASSRG